MGPLGAPRGPVGPWGPKSIAMGAAQKREPPTENCTFWKNCAPWAPLGPLGPRAPPGPHGVLWGVVILATRMIILTTRMIILML